MRERETELEVGTATRLAGLAMGAVRAPFPFPPTQPHEPDLGGGGPRT